MAKRTRTDGRKAKRPSKRKVGQRAATRVRTWGMESGEGPLPGNQDAAALAKARQALAEDAKLVVQQQHLNAALDLAMNAEPMWTLRAQDELAPATIEAWAQKAAARGATPAKVGNAMLDAARIRVWQRRHGCKVPD